LRSGTGKNALNFNAKDVTQMKRIEAVMKENGKAATPGTATGNRMNDKTVASSNFTSDS